MGTLAAVVFLLAAVVAMVSPGVAAVMLLCAILPWSLYQTRRNIVWLLLPLVLIEGVTGSKFLGDQDNFVSAFIRYPLVLLFCAPVLPALWRSGILKKGGFRAFSIYFLWALVSVSYSAIPEMSLGRVVSSVLPFCAICAIVSQLKDKNEGRRAMGVFLLGCGIIVAANVVVLFLLPGEAWGPDPESGIDRFSGTFTEPNQIGVLMLATLGAAFCYWPLVKGRLLKALCAVTMLGALILGAIADSRSPFVGLVVGGAIYLVWNHGARSVFAILGVVAVVYVAVLAVPNGSVYFTRGDVATITGRDVAWHFAAGAIRERPLLGYGYEMEGQIFQSRYFTGWEEVWNQGPRSSIHNGYLSRATSLGIPALIFWMFFMIRPVVSCFRRNYDPWSYRSIALLVLVPILILNITETISDCRSLVGILMGFSWALLENERLLAIEAARERADLADQSKPSLVRALQETAA